MLKKDPSNLSDLNTLEDPDLVKLAQQNSEDAFSVLYERYFHAVYNRVRYKIPEQDVEDVTQEIFIAVIGSLKSFRHQSKFSTWLRTITNRSVADYYRNRKRDKEHLQIDSDISEIRLSMKQSSNVTNTATSIQNRVFLRQGLNALPEHYQEVILLRFAEGLQFKEVADEMDKSLEATKSLFRRAIVLLREQLEDSHE